MRELLSVYRLDQQEQQEIRHFDAPAKEEKKGSLEENPNEQIISLGDDFGKY